MSFEIDSAVLSSQAKETIEKMAQEMLERGYNNIRIEGHTDNTGDDNYNVLLSVKRAQSVCEEFAKNLIEDAQAIGLGASMPIETNKTKEGRQANRRVEVFVEPKNEITNQAQLKSIRPFKINSSVLPEKGKESVEIIAANIRGALYGDSNIEQQYAHKNSVDGLNSFISIYIFY
jgi:hypothetical protein